MSLAGAAAAAAAVEWSDPDAVVSLAVPWKLRAGDDPAWAEPGFDDSGWSEIRIPAGSGRRDVRAEIAWYRLDVQLGPAPLAERPDLRPGVAIGQVDSAYELYAGGIRIGGVGALPPARRIDYDRRGVYAVPSRAVEADGRLVLALRVWKSPATMGTVGGPTEGAFLLGRVEKLTRRELLSELPALFLAGIYLLAGLFHLELFRRRPTLRGYFWFAVVALQFAAYTFLRTQWKYGLADHFLVLKKAEHVLIYLMLPAFVELLWPLLGIRIGRRLRVFQGLSLAAGAVVALSPGLALSQRLLPFWQLGVIGLVIAGLWAILREAWRQHPEARIIAVGAVIAAAAFINDVAVDRGLLIGTRLAAFGFAILVLSLAASLANQFLRIHRELEQLRRELEQRVADRTRDLTAASHAKSRFLATMSHEIRTPLNGVLGMTELLLASELRPAQREYAEIARKSGDVLLSLIDDILDFSKIEAGKIELEMLPFRLRECIEESLDMLASKAAAKGLDLAYRADRLLPWAVVGDAMRLRQVLVNLVGNAIKFTDRGGVLLEVERAGSEDPVYGAPVELHFRVIDTGIGISPEHQERLFEVFSQVDATSTRRHGGAGLGLAISRHLCELMGGRLWVESELGRGSTFHFTIRAEPQEATMDAFLDPRHPDLQGRRALVSEPGDLTREVVSDLLQWWGMEPQIVAGRRQARAAVTGDEPPDVAIVGLWGGADNLLLKELQNTSPELPVIALRRIRMSEGSVEAATSRTLVRLAAPLKPDELLRTMIAIFATPRDQGAPPPVLVPVAAEAAPSSLRILLAEDDEINRMVAVRMLENLGYRADVAGNGLQVLEKMKEATYDVVLLDVQMPELDGLETARRIRRRWPRPGGPRLIAMTADALQGDRDKCLAAGMDDYLRKPVPRSVLHAALARAETGFGPRAPLPAPSVDDTVPIALPSMPAARDGRREDSPGIDDTAPFPMPVMPAAADGQRAGSPGIDDTAPFPMPEMPANEDDGPASSDPILDPAALEQLRQLDSGGGGFLQQVVEVFERDAQRTFRQLREAVAAGDADTVERLAHSLKSSAGQCGGRRMAASCADLEHAANAGALTSADAMLERILGELEILRSELQDQLA